MSAHSCQFFSSRRIFLILILLPSSFAIAQVNQQRQIIEGVVVDERGDPVAAATVTLSADTLTTTTSTDDEGRFRMESIARPPVVVEVAAKGFQSIKRQLDEGAENVTQVRFVLRPAAVSAQVTVTATRTETRLEDTAASVVVLGRTELEITAALTVDDALRQVPGFSLFRRSGSRTANPTTQGVSLRGLGASGASRALVFADGIPLNDPFGGWIYWDRLPRESVAQVEVLEGASSDLYGSTALSGVVSITTIRPEQNSLLLDTSYGNQMSPDASLFLTGARDDWAASLAAEIFRTQGYILVAPAERGPVDTPAASRHSVITLSAERSFSKAQRIFGSASFFGESRENGTPLQTNRTHLRHFSFGGEVTSLKGAFSARGYGGTQVFDQNFSAVTADRCAEALTRLQRVPAQVSGFATQWSRPVGRIQTFVAGFEHQLVRGASDEEAFVNGRPNSLVGAGGRQQTAGIYFEDLIRLRPNFFINGSVRFDYWRNYNALSASRPITATSPTSVSLFPDRSESALSPHLSATYKLNDNFSLLLSGMRAFRAPTLNELYRSFRVGNVLTLANENLRAERLTGAEAGVRINTSGGKYISRMSFFWNAVTRPVANVTLQITPALITRQRQNLGRTASRGLGIQTEDRLNTYWSLSAGYLLADAKVVRFPVNISLEGLMIPQVPRHQFTFQMRYANPSTVTVAFQGRASSAQFDDDQNLFRLGSYFTLDVLVSRRISHRGDVYVAAENLFNQRYEIVKTPVTTLGPPILVRAGLRLHLGAK